LSAHLLIEQGDRIAFLLAALVNPPYYLIMGIEQPTEGTVKLGDHNVIPALSRIRLKPGPAKP